jgi:hypothetical protein
MACLYHSTAGATTATVFTPSGDAWVDVSHELPVTAAPAPEEPAAEAESRPPWPAGDCQRSAVAPPRRPPPLRWRPRPRQRNPPA